MKCEELRVDLRKTTQEERAEGQRCAQLLFQLNHTQFGTEEYDRILRELLGDNLGEDSNIAAPLNGACVSSMKLGKNVFINTNLLAMARGGITIEDDVRIAANVQLISNNHDPYDLPVLLCKPVHIKASSLDRRRSHHPARRVRGTARGGGCEFRGDQGCAGLRCGGGQSGQSGQNAG